jgi:hypothetical protein
METATATPGSSEAEEQIPGGAQPGDDDGFDDGLGGETPPAGAGGQEPPAGTPPTPPANLPDDGGPKDEQKAIPGLELPGTAKLGLRVGGRKPDSNVLKLKGCKIDLPGQYDREDRFLTVTTLQVTGDNDQDTIDTQSGEVKSTSKAQSATLCGISTIEDFLRMKIEDEELLGRVFMALDLEVEEPEPKDD